MGVSRLALFPVGRRMDLERTERGMRFDGAAGRVHPFGFAGDESQPGLSLIHI